MRRPPKPALIAGGAVLAVFVIALAWFLLSTYPLGSSGPGVVVEVKPGETVSQLGSELASKGVVPSTLAFKLDTMIFGAPSITPGYFSIDQNSSYSAVRSVFSNSPNAVVIDVSPGLTIHEVAVDLAAATSDSYASAFLTDAQRAARTSAFAPRGSLEGLIGYGQYVIATGESPAHLVARMQKRFVSEAAQAGITPGATINGLSAYQAVIAASIDEKEGYYPKNMPQVARVILNRLARRAGLQMDATILYALGMDGGTVTPQMLQIHNPYNTYLNAGLTPTPICVVSSYSLHAIAHPPKGSWYYFTLVSRDGTEAFATTFQQQLANEHLAASRGL